METGIRFKKNTSPQFKKRVSIQSFAFFHSFRLPLPQRKLPVALVLRRAAAEWIPPLVGTAKSSVVSSFDGKRETLE
jgi:hypothetical protein